MTKVNPEVINVAPYMPFVAPATHIKLPADLQDKNESPVPNDW